MESVRVVGSLDSVDPQEWNALAGGQPFVRHEFFSALIDTGCAAAASGWLPRFLLLRRAGALVGAMPLFAKSHSYGEYVFDWAWADAHERHGVEYYPKLLCAVPFTPVRGARVLGVGVAEKRLLIEAALELARESSSLHVLFPRQERRRVREAGVAFRWLEGGAIERRHWEYFLRCYRGTYAAHRSRPYLSLEFFLRLGASLPEHTALLLAERDGHPVASALFLADGRSLYGRYWGATERIALLHFECCYYQAIEYAIRRGLEVFEGGAQGEHKLFRGLLPVETVSAHWLAHPRFARAVEDFLEREGAGIARYVDELCEHSPFKRAGEER